MNTYRTLTTTLFRSRLRDPVEVFFSLMFAPILVLILGLVFNALPSNPYGGSYVDTVATATPTVVLAITGVMLIPLRFIQLKQSGAMRRLRLTPLKPSTFIAADLSVNFIITYIGMMLAFAVCWIVFGVALPNNLLGVLGVSAFGLLAFLALGYGLAMLYPSQGAATGIGNGLMIILIMASGMTVPIAILPERERAIFELSPTYQFSDMVQYFWNGQHQLDTWVPYATLGVMIVIFSLIAVWRFDWDRM